VYERYLQLKKGLSSPALIFMEEKAGFLNSNSSFSVLEVEISTSRSEGRPDFISIEVSSSSELTESISSKATG